MSMESKEKKQGALGPKARWSARRKGEVVLRLLRGEPLEALSRPVCRRHLQNPAMPEAPFILLTLIGGSSPLFLPFPVTPRPILVLH
jgi:hypothetical protein